MNNIILESISDGVFTVNLNWEITVITEKVEDIPSITVERIETAEKPLQEYISLI